MLQNAEHGQIFGSQMHPGILHISKACHVAVSHLFVWGSQHPFTGHSVFQIHLREERETWFGLRYTPNQSYKETCV